MTGKIQNDHDNQGLPSGIQVFRSQTGLMIQNAYQGGTGIQGTSAIISCTFPIAFTTAPRVIVTPGNNANGAYNTVSATVTNVTATKFDCYLARPSSGYVGTGYYWIAIGFWK